MTKKVPTQNNPILMMPPGSFSIVEAGRNEHRLILQEKIKGNAKLIAKLERLIVSQAGLPLQSGARSYRRNKSRLEQMKHNQAKLVAEFMAL